MSEKKLFLLDGHALVYRAHFAFISRPLINSKGLNVSAINGFTRLIWDTLRNQKPTHLAVAFDLPGPTFRHEIYPEYKANREAQPEDITAAFPYIYRLLEAFKIPIVTKESYEADDVIGTLAKQAEQEGFEVYMITSDKDYAQLTSDRVYLYKPPRTGNAAEILDAAAVCAKWNIQRPSQVIDMLGLQGDSVDNIPGVPGIGPKTAQKLLAQYDSIEKLIEHADQLKGKQRTLIEEHADLARLSKQLATIDINTPVQFDAAVYICEPFDRPALTALFKELEFRSLSRQILGSTETEATGQKDLFGNPTNTPSSRPKASKSIVADHSIDDIPHTYHHIDTPKGRAELLQHLLKQSAITFDTETTDLNPNQAELVGMSFACQAHEAWYIPIPANQDEAKAIVQEFKPLFEHPDIEKIGQNLKYDIIMLRWYGVNVRGAYTDTMLLHYLCEPDQRHNLNYLAETYLNYTPIPIETLIGKSGKNQLSMRDLPPTKITDYAAEDADITHQLALKLRPMLANAGADTLYNRIEAPLIDVLVHLEYNGIRLDAPFLQEYSQTLQKEIGTLQSTIYEQAGDPFNIDSPKQVGQVLFEKLKLPYRWRKTKTGQYSTNEEKLTELSKEYNIVNDILQYRSLQKLKTTYLDTLPHLVNPRTGRIHSSFNQALAATGRLSSNNPNLQNIPIRTAAGRHIRKAFTPRDADHILLAADYSQIELRLIAHISQDQAMLEAFQQGQDIHRATAARVYDVAYDDVTADQRRNAKTVNFSIIYGAGATNLSRQLDIPRTEARQLIDQYLAQYSGLRQYMDDTVAKARTEGYVTTLMGRRRYLRDINSQNSLLRGHAERNAINSPIQGTAADMIKLAMIDIHRALKEHKLATKMILQVHDELLFDVPHTELETVTPLIRELMQNAIPDLSVPIKVEIGTGQNWLEAH